MSRLVNHWGEPLPVTYTRWLGVWAGFTNWGFAIGSHAGCPGSLIWSWFALVLSRDFYRMMDRQLSLTVAGRTWAVSWNWSPWSYPESEWGVRSVFNPVKFVFSYSKLERYDR
jgi:hypothetical protein